MLTVSYASEDSLIERQFEAVQLRASELLVLEQGPRWEVYLQFDGGSGRWYRNGDWAAAVSLKPSDGLQIDVRCGDVVLHARECMTLPQDTSGPGGSGVARLDQIVFGEGHRVAELGADGWSGLGWGWSAQGVLEVRAASHWPAGHPGKRSRLSALAARLT